MRTLRDNTTGIAIVELLITLIIISTAFGAFMVTFTTIQSINKKAIDLSRANSIAFAKIGEYENRNFSTLPTTNPANTLVEVEDFGNTLPTTMEKPRVGKVYVNTVSGNLKQVVVTITFGTGPSQRQVQYATFIQRNGLGR